jgi:hypothetical protein
MTVNLLLKTKLLLLGFSLWLGGYLLALRSGKAAVNLTGWGLASIILLLAGWPPFSPAGKWAVGIVAIIVDLFATLQFLQWRKMQ